MTPPDLLVLDLNWDLENLKANSLWLLACWDQYAAGFGALGVLVPSF